MTGINNDLGNDCSRALSVIIPTYNEAENIPVLIDRLKRVLNDIDYEIIVVDDDSPDGTWRIVQDIGRYEDRVSVIRRQGVRGLSSAVVTGMSSSKGLVLAVMDADLQHDESILPKMYEAIRARGCDIAVGSREAAGGGYGDWSAGRKVVSFGAKALAHAALDTPIKDPMSGYFAVSRAYFDKTVDKVNPTGFKVLLEFVTRGENPLIEEVGYQFRTRVHGETKLNASVAIEYVLALIDLRFGWLIPNRFVKFGMVGVSGSLVNFIGFAVCSALGASVPLAVFIGVQSAILWTYFGNNLFTFSPVRYRGKSYFKGLVLYELVSVYGLVIQLSVVTSAIFYWPVVGEHLGLKYLAYMVGVAFAALGNYFIHTNYTWNRLGYRLAMPARA